MALKITGCNWCIDVVNYSLLMLSFVATLVLILTTDDDPYLHNNYKRNWDSRYITDVKFVKTEDKCPDGYSQLQLGVWSGFNEGCYCKHEKTGDLWLYDSTCSASFSDAYTCQNIATVPSINLTEYKNAGHFCVKRADKNYYDIFAHVNNKLRQDGKNLYANDKEYFDIALKSTLLDVIDPEAVLDIKLVLNKMKDMFKLEDYKAIFSNDNFGIYIKKLNTQVFPTLFAANDLITDIRLYNYLWCAYLDIGAPDELKFQQTSVQFGYSFCNNLNKENSYAYNDGYKRTVKINTDYSTSRMDFYSKEVMDNIEKQTTLTKLIDNPFEPVLVYEKYYYGLGCKYLLDPLDHLNQLTSNATVRKLSLGTLILQGITQFILIIYIFLKMKDNGRAVSFCIFIIMGLVGVTLFLSLTAMVTARNGYSYFNTYDFWCQNSFNGQRLETMLEVNFKQDLAVAGLLHLGLFVAQAIAAFFLILGFFNNCCCKPTEDDNSSNLELKMNSTINKH
jgi:hypothetical protein